MLLFHIASHNGSFDEKKTIESFYKAVFGTSEYQAIAEQLKLTQPGSTCPAQWTGGTLGIQCLDCQLDPSCVICLPCYFGGDHTKHKIKLFRTSGGCCDCGDFAAWKPEGFCKRHSGINAVTDSAAVLESLPSSLPSVPDFASNVTEVLKQIDNEFNAWIGENKKPEDLDSKVQVQLVTCLNWLTEFASITPAFQYLIGKHVLYESRVREFLDANLQLPKVVSVSFDRLVLVVAGLPSYKMMLARIVFEELPSMIEKQRERCCAADKTISAYLRQFCTMMVQIFTVPEVANEAFSKCLAVKLVQELEKVVVLWGEKKNLVDERPKKKCLALLSMCSDVLVYLLRASCPESFQTEDSLRSVLNLFAPLECLSHQTRRRISHVRIDQFNRSLFRTEEEILFGIIHQSIYWEIPINVKPSSVIKRMNSSLKCQDMAIRIIKKSFAEGSLHWEDFTFQNSLPRFIAATFFHQLFKSALTKTLPVSLSDATAYPQSLLALFDVQFLSELLFVAVRQLTAECEIDKDYWTRNGTAVQAQRAFYLLDTARRPSWDAKLVVFCLCLINLHQKSQAQPAESETNKPGEGPWGLKLLLHLFFPSVCPFCTQRSSSGATGRFCFSEAYQDDMILDDSYQIHDNYPTHKKIIGASFFSSAMRCPLSLTSLHRLIATNLFCWDVDDKRILPETAVRLRREMERRSASGLGFRLFCFWRIMGFICHATQQIEHVNELNEPFSLISASALSSDLSSFDPDERSSVESLPAEYRVSCASESAAAQLSAPSLFSKLSRAILQAGGSCSGDVLWDSLDGSILDNCGFEEALSLVADTKKSSTTTSLSLSRLGISFADLWQPRYYPGSIAKQTPSEYLLNECSKFSVEDSKAPLPSLLGPWRSDYRSVCKPDVFSYVMSSIDFYLSHSVCDSCSGAAHLLSQMVLDVFTLSLESSADDRFVNWKKCLSSCVEELERQNVESEIVGNVQRVLQETMETNTYIPHLPLEEPSDSASLKTMERYSSTEDTTIWYLLEEVEQMGSGSSAFNVEWIVELQRLAEEGLEDAKKETPEVRRSKLRSHLLEMREDVVAASLKVLVSGVMMLWDRKYDENNKSGLSSFDIDEHLECDKQRVINALENVLKKQKEEIQVCGELEPHLIWAVSSAVKKLKDELSEGKDSSRVDPSKNKIHQGDKISEDDQNDEKSLLQKRKAELHRRQMLIQSHFSKQIELISESLTSDGIEVYDSKSTFPAPATNIDEEIQIEKAPKGLFFGRLDSVEGFLTRYFKKMKTDSQFSFSKETKDALSWHNDTESICVFCRTGSSPCRPLCSLIFASPSNSLRRLNYPLVSSPESNNPNLYKASLSSLAENRLYPFVSASIASCGHQAHYSCLMNAHRHQISKCPLCRFMFNHSLPNIPNCSGLQFMSSTPGSGYYGTQESSVVGDSSGLLSLAEVESQIQRTLNWKEDSDEQSSLALGMAGPVIELGVLLEETRIEFQISGLEISRNANLDHDFNGVNGYESDDMSDYDGDDIGLTEDEDDDDNMANYTFEDYENMFEDPRNYVAQFPPANRNAEIVIGSEQDGVDVTLQLGELPSASWTPSNNHQPDISNNNRTDRYSALEMYGALDDLNKKVREKMVSTRLKDRWLPPKRLTDQIQLLIGDDVQEDLAKHWGIPEVSFFDLAPAEWVTSWRLIDAFWTPDRDDENDRSSSFFWYYHSLYRNDSPLLWVVLTQLLLVSRCNLPVVLQTKTAGGPKHIYVHLIRLIWFFGLQNVFKTDQQHQSDVDYWIPKTFAFRPDLNLFDIKTTTPNALVEINSPWLADVRVEFLRQFLKAPKVHCEGSNPKALLIFRSFVKKMIRELTALNSLQTLHALVVEFVRRILTERKFKRGYRHSCVKNDEMATESSTPKCAIQFVCDPHSPYELKKKMQKCEKSPSQQKTQDADGMDRVIADKSVSLSETSMREIMATFLSCMVDKLKGFQTTLAAPHSAAADFEDLAIRLAWWRLGRDKKITEDNDPKLRDNKAMTEDNDATSIDSAAMTGGTKIENPPSLSEITEDDKLFSFCNMLCGYLVLFDNECAKRTVTSDGCCVGHIGRVTLEKAFQRAELSSETSLDSLIADASLKLEFRQFRSTPGPGFASHLEEFSDGISVPRLILLLATNFRMECGRDSDDTDSPWIDCIIETFREYLPLPPLLCELINFPFDSDVTSDNSYRSSGEWEYSMKVDYPRSLSPRDDGEDATPEEYDFNLHSYFDFLCNAVREQFEIDDKNYRQNVEVFWRQEAEPSIENVTEPLLTFFSVAITALWNLEDCDYNSIVYESSNIRTRLDQLCQVLLLGDVFSVWTDSADHRDKQSLRKGSTILKSMAAMMWNPRIVLGTQCLRLVQTHSPACLPVTIAGSLDVPLPPGGPSQWRDDLSASFSIPNIREQMQKKITIGKLPSLLPVPFLPSDSISALRRVYGGAYASQQTQKQSEIPVVCLICGELHHHYLTSKHGASCGGGESFYANFFTFKFRSEIESANNDEESDEIGEIGSWSRPLPYLTEFGETDEKLKRGCITHLDHASLELTIREHLLGKIQRGTEIYMEIDFLQELI